MNLVYLPCLKGLFKNNVSNQKGDGEEQTKMLTMDDEGGRGGKATADISWQRGWGSGNWWNHWQCLKIDEKYWFLFNAPEHSNKFCQIIYFLPKKMVIQDEGVIKYDFFFFKLTRKREGWLGKCWHSWQRERGVFGNADIGWQRGRGSWGNADNDWQRGKGGGGSIPPPFLLT